MTRHYENLIVIGSSAGGPRILKMVFQGLPLINCAMVLVQHMPRFINQSLCNDLNQITDMEVRLANTGDELKTGVVYIAPADYHLILNQNRFVELISSPKVNFVRPAVDVTMQSLAPLANGILMGVILTGMGRDGADGLVHLKRIGATTIAQDEKTSIIYGMPKEAVATGCVDYILTPTQIQSKWVQVMSRLRKNG